MPTQKFDEQDAESPTQIIKTPIGPYTQFDDRRMLLQRLVGVLGDYEDVLNVKLKASVTFPDGTKYKWRKHVFSLVE